MEEWHVCNKKQIGMGFAFHGAKKRGMEENGTFYNKNREIWRGVFHRVEKEEVRSTSVSQSGKRRYVERTAFKRVKNENVWRNGTFAIKNRQAWSVSVSQSRKRRSKEYQRFIEWKKKVCEGNSVSWREKKRYGGEWHFLQ